MKFSHALFACAAAAVGVNAADAFPATDALQCPEWRPDLVEASTLIWPDIEGDTRTCGNANEYIEDYCNEEDSPGCNNYLISMCCEAEDDENCSECTQESVRECFDSNMDGHWEDCDYEEKPPACRDCSKRNLRHNTRGLQFSRVDLPTVEPTLACCVPRSDPPTVEPTISGTTDTGGTPTPEPTVYPTPSPPTNAPTPSGTTDTGGKPTPQPTVLPTPPTNAPTPSGTTDTSDPLTPEPTFYPTSSECVDVSHVNDRPGYYTCDCVPEDEYCLTTGQCVLEPGCPSLDGQENGQSAPSNPNGS